jgi:hypothetical protein
VVVEPHREDFPPLIVIIIKIEAVETLSGLHGFFYLYQPKGRDETHGLFT